MKTKAVIQNGIVQTMCRMCDTRCAIKVHINDGTMVDISPDDHHPVNEGRMCARGAAAIDFCYHPDRLLKPLKKMSDGTFMEIPYEQAIDEIAEKVLHIKKKIWRQSDECLEGRSCRVLPARRLCQTFYSSVWIS